MKITKEVVEELDKWKMGDPSVRVNQFVHEPTGLSLRATHPAMEKGQHLAPTDRWAIEIYPSEGCPIVNQDAKDIVRWEPTDVDSARRLIIGIMIGMAIAETEE